MVESTGAIQSPAQAKPAVSDTDKAKQEAAAAAEVAAHPSSGKFVQYLGPRNVAAAVEADEFKTRAPKLGEGTVAEITTSQWTQAGIPGPRTHKWSLANNWRVPATQFTQDQIDYLLENSKRFELVDAKGQKVDS
jgi:hypothetical protein